MKKKEFSVTGCVISTSFILVLWFPSNPHIPSVFFFSLFVFISYYSGGHFHAKGLSLLSFSNCFAIKCPSHILHALSSSCRCIVSVATVTSIYTLYTTLRSEIRALASIRFCHTDCQPVRHHLPSPRIPPRVFLKPCLGR